MKSTFLSVLLLSAAINLRGELTAVGYDKSLYTSDFMIGDVVVAIVFPESDGTLDPNFETWSTARQSQAISEIMAGLEWWTEQNPHSPLSFTYVTETVSTKYEPILRPYYDEGLWIPDMMSKLGYSGNRFTATRNYINTLRNTYDADWGFVIFVVDSLQDSNGKLADGYFAYAYLGGPFMVMTYDNNGYGITNMDVVAAHEAGHVFHALDQYAGASSPYSYSFGYYSVINGNHAYSTTANEPNSIMRGGIRWGLDNWAREMVGWRDNNNNEVDDILDITPTITISDTPTPSGGSSLFSGSASVQVIPRQGNSYGYGFTVDTIAQVEYKIGNGDWTQANPNDGSFNQPAENFNILISPSESISYQSVQSTDLTVRAKTTLTLYSGTSGGGFGAPGTLNSAHAYPNPFKPNSSQNYQTITFAGLTDSSKVQIFNPVGDPIFDGTASGSPPTLSWDGRSSGGDIVGSGVYFFLITDSAGNKKKGKLAIIR